MSEEIRLMLVSEAEKMRKAAYAPYSGLWVGAGICAERSAFCTAISAGEKDFEAIAVAGGKSFGKITDYCPPCGICRQFMTEFCGGDFKIILSDGKNIREYDLSFLAPFGFDKNRFGI